MLVIGFSRESFTRHILKRDIFKNYCILGKASPLFSEILLQFQLWQNLLKVITVGNKKSVLYVPYSVHSSA